ncbi:MAG: response regulator [Candidatus Omnitrophica bacterium]|nr:response regulator [Candidatus Omnitrophota bacterium]
MGKKKILIVDDEEHILAVLEKRLEASGYDVIKAVNGKEALEAAKSAIPDLVVTDLVMPNMDGAELADAMESDPVTRGIPVIILTALIKKGKEEKQFISHRRSLAKPYDPQELIKVIAEMLELYDNRGPASGIS